tara:strand:- start:221 stop:514 length:294 start_codon:yes stop_codon:yes gene_type:complete
MVRDNAIRKFTNIFPHATFWIYFILYERDGAIWHRNGANLQRHNPVCLATVVWTHTTYIISAISAVVAQDGWISLNRFAFLFSDLNDECNVLILFNL